jgi:putative hydrolase of the HAD superfamily
VALRGLGPLPVSAVVLDVGGVFLVPDHTVVRESLAALGVEVDQEVFRRGHYEGMASIDRASARGEVQGAYLEGMLSILSPHRDQQDAARNVLVAAFRDRHWDIWAAPVSGSAEALRELDDLDLRLAIVSNSDGTVEERLRLAGVCQVGRGRGVSVAAVVDSGAVGVAKPDPAIFDPALLVLGVEAHEAIYVGDSVHFDVEGARSAGLRPVHFDPEDLCRAADHEHVSSLGDVVSDLGPPARS